MIKSIYEVYQLMSFRCIMSLSYRVTFLCNVLCKFIIHQKALYDFFLMKKVVKWCIVNKIFIIFINTKHCCYYFCSFIIFILYKISLLFCSVSNFPTVANILTYISYSLCTLNYIILKVT